MIGRIEVICGSMFSGKTEELIRRLKRLKYANQSFKVFKPEIDTRNKKNIIKSHGKIEIEAKTVSKKLKEILDLKIKLMSLQNILINHDVDVTYEQEVVLMKLKFF